jgi:cell division protein FtsI/penicillin-binding protein 2
MPTSALFAASAWMAAQTSSPSIIVMRVRDGQVLRRSGPAVLAARPGSTIKPFALAALLAQKEFDASKRIACAGKLQIAGRKFDCTHGPVAPALNAVDALAFSCNRYFFHWSHLLTGDKLVRALAAFHLAAEPPASEPQRAMLALGEWGIAVTPEELAEAYRALALRLEEFPVIAEGLREACRRGTAREAGAEFAGKTGTAATASRLSLQAWFAGFTPPRAPQTVVVVYVPRGRGAADAAPLARKALA